LKKWISPYYFATAVIAGVTHFVRRMTKTSALEMVPEEDLAALQRSAVERIRANDVTRSAAGTTRPEMTKRIDVSDGFIGNAGPQPKEESPLLRDPDYLKARAAGDTEAMARIAAEFGRRKR